MLIQCEMNRLLSSSSLSTIYSCVHVQKFLFALKWQRWKFSEPTRKENLNKRRGKSIKIEERKPWNNQLSRFYSTKLESIVMLNAVCMALLLHLAVHILANIYHKLFIIYYYFASCVSIAYSDGIDASSTWNVKLPHPSVEWVIIFAFEREEKHYNSQSIERFQFVYIVQRHENTKWLKFDGYYELRHDNWTQQYFQNIGSNFYSFPQHNMLQ